MQSRRVREIGFLAVGISTPVGVLAVNGSAFVMRHLPEFRTGIAACALLSGLALNGLGASVAATRARRYAPLLYAEYRRWVVATVVVYVIAWSGAGAYFTYNSLQDASKLPNLSAVLTAIVLLLVPFGMTVVSRRLNLAGMEEKEEQRKGGEPRRRARST